MKKWFNPDEKPQWAKDFPAAEQNKWIFRAMILAIAITLLYLLKFYI